MAVDVETSSITYSGNGSTVNGYPIPFPFVHPDDIKVGVILPGATVRNEITGYIVTTAPNQVITSVAYAANVSVVVYRKMRLTQPTSYPPGGPFAAKSHEAALDRVVMMIQQLALAIDGSGAFFAGTTGIADVVPFANVAARGLSKPSRIGQLGVQIDTGDIYRSTAVQAGAWTRAVMRTWNWAREVWGFSESLGVATRYAGHVNNTGTIKRIRFSHAINAPRTATVNLLVNGAPILTSNLVIDGSTVVVSSGFAVTTLNAGDRIEAQVVSIVGGGFYDPVPLGLQVEIETEA